MPKNWFSNLSTPLRYLFISLFALLILASIGSWWVKQKVTAAIGQNQTNIGLIEYENLYVSLLKGTISFEGLQWSTTLAETFPTNNSSSLNATAQKAMLDGISWSNIIFNQQLIADEFRIEHPAFIIREIDQKIDTTTTTTETEEEKKLTAAKLHKVSITQGSYLVFAAGSDSSILVSIDSLFMEIDLLEVKAPTDSVHFTVDNIEFGGQNFNLRSSNGLYDFFIEKMAKDTKEELFTIENFALKPRHSKQNFAKQLEDRKGRLTMQIPKIYFQDIDIDRLLLDRSLQVEQVTVESPQLEVYVDQNIPKDESRMVHLPTKILQDLAFNLNIRTIAIKNGKIELEQLAPKREDIGKINFQKIYATLHNVTNDSLQLVQNSQATANIIAQFMGSGALALDIALDWTDPQHAYDYEVTLGQFDLEEINEMLVQAMLVKLESGQIEKLHAKVTANRQVAQGELTFDFTNLDFKLLDKNYQTNRKLLTSLLKALTMPNDNMPNQKKYRQGKIYYEKVPADSFFRYLWRSVLSGLQSILVPNLFLSDELDKEKPKKSK